mgnify:CR=1 FL=1
MQKFTGVVMQKESPRNHRSHDNHGPEGRPENGVNVVGFFTVWGFNKLKNCIDQKIVVIAISMKWKVFSEKDFMNGGLS